MVKVGCEPWYTMYAKPSMFTVIDVFLNRDYYNAIERVKRAASTRAVHRRSVALASERTKGVGTISRVAVVAAHSGISGGVTETWGGDVKESEQRQEEWKAGYSGVLHVVDGGVEDDRDVEVNRRAQAHVVVLERDSEPTKTKEHAVRVQRDRGQRNLRRRKE